TLRAEIDLPNADSKCPDDLPAVVRDSVTKVHLPKTPGQILPGMYAYGAVTIKRANVMALPQSALDYEHGKTFYWAYEKGHAARMEVRTAVSDDDWTEVTNRRPYALDDRHPWAPIDGTEQAIVGDFAALSDGIAVHLVGDEDRSVVEDQSQDTDRSALSAR
ncbi:MAG TPA: hypothetical protein VG713_17390, partial [Pirellulales bacterium]|nr:hypothetical protein [Pirellulales bacterium]